METKNKNNNNNSPFLMSDVGAEQIIIAGAILNTNWADEILQICNEEDFSDPFYKAMFRVVKGIRGDQRTPDLTVVVDYLKQFGVKMPESQTISGLIANPPLHDDDLKAKIERLHEKTNMRRLYHAAALTVAKLKEGEPVDKTLLTLAKDLEKIDTTRGFERTYLSPSEWGQSILDTVAEYADPAWREKNIIRTGFKVLDAVIGGFTTGNLVIISGATGTGKSAFSINLGWRMGAEKPVLYINSEMTQQEVNLRMASLTSGVEHDTLREGKASPEEYEKVVAGAEKVTKRKLSCDRIPDLALNKIEARLNFAAAQGIKCVIVDYIGRMDLLSAYEKGNGQEWQLLSATVQKLKTFAEQKNLLIIIIAQTAEDGTLARSKYMLHEADCWINLLKDKSEAPYNFKLELKKVRNASDRNDVSVYYSGRKMYWTDNEEEARELYEQEKDDEEE